MNNLYLLSNTEFLERTSFYIMISSILLYILLRISYSKLRGIIGEYRVKNKLKKLPNDQYLILNNIMIKSNDKTYQIDHIVISKYGIFVIEMKNYYGTIIGDDNRNKWAQLFVKKRSYFMNPIHQNYGHIKALEEVLNIDSKVFIPIVCFSDSVKLKVDSKTNVVKLNRLVSTILGKQNILIDSDLNEIYHKIVESNIVDKNERKKHVKNIKKRLIEDNEKIDNMICPKCGGKLISKNGKYGPFIGCSHYPYCRFIKKN